MKGLRLLLFFLLPVCIPLHAQKVITVSGTYIYVIPEEQSYSEAKATALQRAQLQILADTFGTTLDMTAVTSVSGGGVASRMLSESQVRGEWLETIGEPKFTRIVDENSIAVKVEIKGKVREIVASASEFDARILCGVPDLRFEKTDFKSGDDLFLYFKSSSDGWTAVYLYDGDDSVFCLLPYSSDGSGVCQVKGNVPYYFFSEEKAERPSLVDEYTMTCSATSEVNRIYVLFSPSRFTKAVDNSGGAGLPRMLTYEDFQSWLFRIRSADGSLSVKTTDITIRK